MGRFKLNVKVRWRIYWILLACLWGFNIYMLINRKLRKPQTVTVQFQDIGAALDKDPDNPELLRKKAELQAVFEIIKPFLESNIAEWEQEDK